jgi:UDP-N-acetylmuramoyl-tripeptide--D-alanyl-D-alanine ligase
MKKMNLEEISAACGGQLVSGKDIIITSIVTDSRKAAAGCLFAAIKGERTDGHNFIKTAAQQGAAAVLCEKAPENTDIPYILTSSTLKALQDIAAYILKKAEIPVVGIGGSVGKTSTKEAVAAVLSQKYSVLKTEANFNNDLGLPLTVFNLEESNNAAVLEMGISDFGEMHLLASIARPDICILTNIGDCHLENLGDRAGVFKAKTEMFDFLEPSGHIILNGDDEYLKNVGDVNGVKPIFFGLEKANDFWADNIKAAGIYGISCDIHGPEAKFSTLIPKPGLHMVYNALAAAAAGSVMGLSPEEIKRGIEQQENVGGRFNIIEKNGITIIDDCYNANPMSMKASLESLSRADSRRVAVLGDMGELGKNEKELHGQVGEFAAGLPLDAVICIGSLSRYIAEKAAENHAIQVVCFDDKESFLKDKGSYIKSGDTVLVKASHFMDFKKIVNELAGD